MAIDVISIIRGKYIFSFVIIPGLSVYGRPRAECQTSSGAATTKSDSATSTADV